MSLFTTFFAGWGQEVGVILIFLGITEVRVEKSSSLPSPDHLQVDPANAWALVGSRNRRERRQRVGTGLVYGGPLASFGKPRSDAPRRKNGLISPPEKKSGAVAGGTSFVQDLRTVRLTSLSSEEQTCTLQQLL